jgi:hypothetical protein
MSFTNAVSEITYTSAIAHAESVLESLTTREELFAKKSELLKLQKEHLAKGETDLFFLVAERVKTVNEAINLTLSV